MDPVEDRDVSKLMEMLDLPEVQNKISQLFLVAPGDGCSFGRLVPRVNVVEE